MKIVCIKGGLGNQLFEYCRYHGLLRQHNNHGVYLHYDRRRTKQHGGVWLDKAFLITLPTEPWRVKLMVMALKMLRKLHLFKRLYREDDPRSVLIDDYSQHKQFIVNAAEILNFRPFAQLDYADEITSEPFPVSVHVRRGDYLLPANKANFGVCSVHYYLSAAVAVRERHPDARFFVFSDDIEWTKMNLNLPNCVFVEHAQPQFLGCLPLNGFISHRHLPQAMVRRTHMERPRHLPTALDRFVNDDENHKIISIFDHN